MNKLFKTLSLPLLMVSICGLTGCDLFGGGNNSNIHTKSYDAITGKFVLYQATDQLAEYTDTYFDIDGSEGNFTMKYYENGTLKKEGVFQKVVERPEKIGLIQDNLHFNVKCGNTYEHISTYTESLDPINQFRIIEEYHDSNKKYYLSELPFVMGTYVREGQQYQKEAKTTADKDYTVATQEHFTAQLDGRFELEDEEHYFYFVYPIINSSYAFSYFQYYSPDLAKPLEGFAYGRAYTSLGDGPKVYLTYSREVLYDKSYKDTANNIVFGYYSFVGTGEDQRMVEHWGSVTFDEDGDLDSFTFEHLSRNWTEKEWDQYTRDVDYQLPDAILYEYEGGTYEKVYFTDSSVR